MQASIKPQFSMSLPSIALWRELERPFDLATALNRLAGALLAIHEYAAVNRHYEECRDIYQSLGYRRGVALAIQNLGGVAYKLGDYVRARALFCDALANTPRFRSSARLCLFI